MVIANGGYSKGKPVSPLSNLQDGLFNLNYTIVSHKPGKRKFIKMFNKGDHIYSEDTKQHWLTQLKITNADKKIKALIDGKMHNLEELNISILEGALKIYKK
jgi:diacylglycerol kinase family enzyme